MDLKTLVAKEKKECRERMIKETTGLYVLIYIGIAFCILMSAMFGFQYEEGDYVYLITFAIMNGAIYDAFTRHISSVKENGNRIEIFKKYIYTPVEPKLLMMAKLIVTARLIGVPVILSQLVALFIRAIDPDNDGGGFGNITVWIPIICGLLYLIFDAVTYIFQCYGAGLCILKGGKQRMRDKAMDKRGKINIVPHWLPNVLMVLFAVCITLLRVPEELEIMTEDSLYQQLSAIPEDIKIIGIDETTLKELGPYSEWDRSLFIKLIEILNSDCNAKPKVIGVDVIFTGTRDTDEDLRLAETVAKSGNVILASKLDIDTRVVVSENEGEYSLQNYIKDEITAYEALYNASASGFTNIILDKDGYVRRAYTYIKTDEKIYKSFAYLIAERITESPKAMSELPQIVEIPYYGEPGDFEVIPMSKVLDGTVPADYFADSVVLVGAYEEGLLDSYRVPIDHSGQMYGVECHANAIWAFAKQKRIYNCSVFIEALLAGLVAALFGILARKSRLRTSVIAMLGIIIIYPVIARLFFDLTNIKLSILYIPIAVVVEFFVFLILRYVEEQKKRADEMQNMLFSMADSMAVAIEGRTPYNANHTKNVANRCLEMLDYINDMHKKKRTEMYFSDKDKNQLYLAAMLHDIGKMDVPLKVMNKSTKLGSMEEPLRSRLEIIMLKLKIDALTGNVSKEKSEEQIGVINTFLERLEGYNCGRPLKEDEWEFIDRLGTMVYTSEDGEEIPFLTADELENLHIKVGTLSDRERNIMQSHVVYTDKILSHMQFGEDYKDVRTMAANHHELLNAKGYPNGIGADKLDVMTRILTIMDIYDSLIADDRPYKKAKPVGVAFDILEEEAQAGKIDKELLEIAKELYYKEG